MRKIHSDNKMVEILDMQKVTKVEKLRPIAGGHKSTSSLVPLIPADRDYLGLLSAVYARKKKAVLIFCPTKNLCEEVAKRLCVNQLPRQFPEYAKSAQNCKGANEFTDLENEVKGLCDQYRRLGIQLSKQNEVYDPEL